LLRQGRLDLQEFPLSGGDRVAGESQIAASSESQRGWSVGSGHARFRCESASAACCDTRSSSVPGASARRGRAAASAWMRQRWWARGRRKVCVTSGSGWRVSVPRAYALWDGGLCAMHPSPLPVLRRGGRYGSRCGQPPRRGLARSGSSSRAGRRRCRDLRRGVHRSTASGQHGVRAPEGRRRVSRSAC
jgi:hypothetical protein